MVEKQIVKISIADLRYRRDSIRNAVFIENALTFAGFKKVMDGKYHCFTVWMRYDTVHKYFVEKYFVIF